MYFKISQNNSYTKMIYSQGNLLCDPEFHPSHHLTRISRFVPVSRDSYAYPRSSLLTLPPFPLTSSRCYRYCLLRSYKRVSPWRTSVCSILFRNFLSSSIPSANPFERREHTSSVSTRYRTSSSSPRSLEACSNCIAKKRPR